MNQDLLFRTNVLCEDILGNTTLQIDNLFEASLLDVRGNVIWELFGGKG